MNIAKFLEYYTPTLRVYRAFKKSKCSAFTLSINSLAKYLLRQLQVFQANSQLTIQRGIVGNGQSCGVSNRQRRYHRESRGLECQRL